MMKKELKKFTVFFDQVNRTNFQVLAETPQEAEKKGDKLYMRDFSIPISDAQEGWLVESDGADK
jgi:hypothetical protein